MVPLVYIGGNTDIVSRIYFAFSLYLMVCDPKFVVLILSL
jgi:hypothetical protein